MRCASRSKTACMGRRVGSSSWIEQPSPLPNVYRLPVSRRRLTGAPGRTTRNSSAFAGPPAEPPRCEFAGKSCARLVACTLIAVALIELELNDFADESLRCPGGGTRIESPWGNPEGADWLSFWSLLTTLSLRTCFQNSCLGSSPTDKTVFRFSVGGVARVKQNGWIGAVSSGRFRVDQRPGCLEPPAQSGCWGFKLSRWRGPV